MPPARSPRLAAIAALLMFGASCSAGGGGSSPTVLDNVGRIPGVSGVAGSLIIDGVRAYLAPLAGATLAANAKGNRLLVIGDSILAGTTSRYGGAMCSALVPQGWKVAVEAEPGRLIPFGREVLRKRIYEGWDAAVVFLGTNYGGSAERYASDLGRIVESLAPRPTLLITATVFKPTIQEVNTEIRLAATRNPNVSILDWSATSIQPGLLNDDGVHPNNTGRSILVASVAAAVGRAPGAEKGSCLPSLFTDDTLGADSDVLPTTTVPGAAVESSTTSVLSGSSTTQNPATTTTSTTVG